MEIFISIIKRIVSIFIVIVFMIAAFFFLFLKGDKNGLPSFLPFVDKTINTTSSGIASEKQITELQQTLSELERVKINSDFFNSSAFESLENFKRPLPKLQQARENPFAPIGE